MSGSISANKKWRLPGRSQTSDRRNGDLQGLQLGGPTAAIVLPHNNSNCQLLNPDIASYSSCGLTLRPPKHRHDRTGRPHADMSLLRPAARSCLGAARTQAALPVCDFLAPALLSTSSRRWLSATARARATATPPMPPSQPPPAKPRYKPLTDEQREFLSAAVSRPCVQDGCAATTSSLAK